MSVEPHELRVAIRNAEHDMRDELATAIADLRAELRAELRELDARLTGVHTHALRSLTATLSGKDANDG